MGLDEVALTGIESGANRPRLIDCPVDFTAHLKLTEKPDKRVVISPNA